MKSYLFVFGRTPKLSLLELQTFFPNAVALGETLGFVQSNSLFSIDRLGGIVKIAQVIGESDQITPEVFVPHLTGIKNFGISSYDYPVTRVLLEHVKQLVGGRFVENLTSVLITKQHVTEIVIAKYEEKYLLGKTVAVQDFEVWNKRDYGRPFADPKAGMLPPKVARMAVNIAGNPGTLLDPFCGMGTILAEASLAGWVVLGSDQNDDVVQKARENLTWLGVAAQMFVSEAPHISEKIEKNSIDAVVTEPFMGENIAHPRGVNAVHPGGVHSIKNIVKGLEKLYIGCLKDWQKVLKDHGKVVIALPQYAVSKKTFFVKRVIDNCENLGYTVLHGPIEYSRPQAIVRRQFFVLQKNYGTH